jgi:hypothetical protein
VLFVIGQHLGDFIAPKESGVKDYIGAFAVTAGGGIDKRHQYATSGRRRGHDDMRSVRSHCSVAGARSCGDASEVGFQSISLFWWNG